MSGDRNDLRQLHTNFSSFVVTSNSKGYFPPAHASTCEGVHTYVYNITRQRVATPAGLVHEQAPKTLE